MKSRQPERGVQAVPESLNGGVEGIFERVSEGQELVRSAITRFLPPDVPTQFFPATDEEFVEALVIADVVPRADRRGDAERNNRRLHHIEGALRPGRADVEGGHENHKPSRRKKQQGRGLGQKRGTENKSGERVRAQARIAFGVSNQIEEP